MNAMSYDVLYDDGDFERNVAPKFTRCPSNRDYGPHPPTLRAEAPPAPMLPPHPRPRPSERLSGRSVAVGDLFRGKVIDCRPRRTGGDSEVEMYSVLWEDPSDGKPQCKRHCARCHSHYPLSDELTREEVLMLSKRCVTGATMRSSPAEPPAQPRNFASRTASIPSSSEGEASDRHSSQEPMSEVDILQGCSAGTVKRAILAAEARAAEVRVAAESAELEKSREGQRLAEEAAKAAQATAQAKAAELVEAREGQRLAEEAAKEAQEKVAIAVKLLEFEVSYLKGKRPTMPLTEIAARNLLGLDGDPKQPLTAAQVRKAYLFTMRKFHPDKVQNYGLEKQGAKACIYIQEAADCLTKLVAAQLARRGSAAQPAERDSRAPQV